MDLIGAGSTPLHYAACGGNVKSCQALIAKGASRTTLNSNGWLPFDVAGLWARHWLEPLLAPNSDVIPSTFPPSKYLALPLLSILSIAREQGLQSDSASSDDSDICYVCLERACTVAAEGCAHEFCVKCALYLCSTISVTAEVVNPPGSIRCPLCRNGIMSFIKLPCSPVNDLNLDSSLVLCTSCMPQTHGCVVPSTGLCRADFHKLGVASGSSDIFCTVSCTPFPSVTMPSCTGSEANYLSHESPPEATREKVLHVQQDVPMDLGSMEGTGIEKMTGCSMLFRHRRSFQREQQCASEINV